MSPEYTQTKEGCMVSIFNYNTLEVSLNRQYKSLTINLNRPERENALNFEMLFELETILSWASNHLEINTIVVSSTDPTNFSVGYDQLELASISTEKLRKFHNRVRKLAYSMHYLPQTVIFDLKKRALNIAIELSLGGDMRFVAPGADIRLNHLEIGITPGSGGIGILSKLVDKSYQHKWILGGQKISRDDLLSSGLASGEYANSTDISLYLESISKQSPVARIQAKRALLEELLEKIEHINTYENNIAFSSLITQDWKLYIEAKESNSEVKFTPPQMLASLIKRNSETTL